MCLLTWRVLSMSAYRADPPGALRAQPVVGQHAARVHHREAAGQGRTLLHFSA